MLELSSCFVVLSRRGFDNNAGLHLPEHEVVETEFEQQSWSSPVGAGDVVAVLVMADSSG